MTLKFAEGGEWAAECSCPMGHDCKHIVAALLALEENASVDGPAAAQNLSTSARQRIAQARRARWQAINGTRPGAKRPPAVPQPPRSPLYDKLVEHLGRELGMDEAQFV